MAKNGMRGRQTNQVRIFEKLKLSLLEGSSELHMHSVPRMCMHTCIVLCTLAACVLAHPPLNASTGSSEGDARSLPRSANPTSPYPTCNPKGTLLPELRSTRNQFLIIDRSIHCFGRHSYVLYPLWQRSNSILLRLDPLSKSCDSTDSLITYVERSCYILMG